MNATQQRYAKDRLQQVYMKKRGNLQAQYKNDPKPTLAEKLVELRAGRYHISDEAEVYGYGIEGYIVFDKWPPVDAEAREKALKNLEDAYRNLMDELVLGDNQEALKLIRSFEDDESWGF